MIFPEIGQASKLSENILHNYSKMAAQTGSTYVYGTMIDSVEIPTANLRFSSVNSSKKVPPNDCDDDRQPEIAIWLLKPEVLIALATL